MATASDIRDIISGSGLKVTPQRFVILKAMLDIKAHPSADQIIEYIRKRNPNISIGTVYNVLEAFVEKGIIKRVRTEDGIQRYDAMKKKHHHIYYTDTREIKDYYDPELTKLLEDYFRQKQITDFEIEDLNLHIIGKRV